MKTFTALLVDRDQGKEDKPVMTSVEDVDESALTVSERPDTDVLLKVAYSSVNYKDMLAVREGGGVIRSYPMIPGIDAAGTIEEPGGSGLQRGQAVLVTGYGFGVSHTGGFAQYARVPSDWLVPLPHGLSLREAMVLGTAGLTAALSIQALEKAGLSTVQQPAILVTGASGGVGSLALLMLRQAGYQSVTALIRQDRQIEFVKRLGASAVLDARELESAPKPLGKQVYDYVLDTVGGQVAAGLIPNLRHGGAMSLCGNAGGISLKTTVLPLILRGVSLLGIDSVNVPADQRIQLWERLATEWNVAAVAPVTEVGLSQLPDVFAALGAGRHLGRTVVRLW